MTCLGFIFSSATKISPNFLTGGLLALDLQGLLDIRRGNKPFGSQQFPHSGRGGILFLRPEGRRRFGPPLLQPFDFFEKGGQVEFRVADLSGFDVGL